MKVLMQQVYDFLLMILSVPKGPEFILGELIVVATGVHKSLLQLQIVLRYPRINRYSPQTTAAVAAR